MRHVLSLLVQHFTYVTPSIQHHADWAAVHYQRLLSSSAVRCGRAVRGEALNRSLLTSASRTVIALLSDFLTVFVLYAINTTLLLLPLTLRGTAVRHLLYEAVSGSQ